jgi:hypothetical protein
MRMEAEKSVVLRGAGEMVVFAEASACVLDALLSGSPKYATPHVY